MAMYYLLTIIDTNHNTSLIGNYLYSGWNHAILIRALHLKLHILFWLKQSKKSDKWYFKCFNELGEWWISSCTCSLERHTLLHTRTGSSCSNYSLSLPEKIRLQLYSVMCLFVENKIYLVIRFVHAICFHHECIMHM